MRRWLTYWAMVGVLTALDASAAMADGEPNWDWLVVADGPAGDAERRAIVAALRLLPRLPARVAVIDAERAKLDVRKTLLRLDAFVVKGSPVVYVLRHGALLRGAIKASAFHTHALASVIWHEIAHADGADEREARQREQDLWATFVRDQRVDPVLALRYLDALTKRPDAHMLAVR